MGNVISVKNLCKKYRNFELKNVSFDIPMGCVAGFIGLNGQGKTTTIRTILGLSKKSSGEISILDKDIDKYEKELKDKIGVVFDEGYLYDSLKMYEMKSIVSNAYSSWDEKKYKELMKRFSLDETQKIVTLSKGMRMKFALVLALSHHAEFLIMDEPTSGLDPLVRKELLTILSEYMEEEGKGVFYSTHITSDLDKFADIIVFINNGKVVFVEDKDYLLDSHIRVKGDRKYLDKETSKLFVNIEKNDYGFVGITNDIASLEKIIPNLVKEKVNIEEVMLAYVQGGKANV